MIFGLLHFKWKEFAFHFFVSPPAHAQKGGVSSGARAEDKSTRSEA
jgi:hypothetical protein